MKRTKLTKVLSFMLCIVLIAAMALFTTACNDNETQESVNSTTQETNQTPTEVGEGATEFNFTVISPDGTETKFLVKTDATTVGEALQKLEIIAGDEGEYGLYIKTVNGITLDYDKDQMYWAFYEDGEYALQGIDSTNIKEGVEYKLEATKG